MLKLARNHNRGRLLVFEGTDGAGKTTLIRQTMLYLGEKLGEDRLLLLKQPTDLARKTKLFQKMMYCSAHDEIDYRAVQLLTLSDRVQHNREVIVPALEAGKLVVCDRYLYTSIVNMLARGYRRERWFFLACRSIVRPDLGFLAYADPELAIERIRRRPEECRRHLDEQLLRSVAREFLRRRGTFALHLIDTAREPEVAFAQMRPYLNRLAEEMKP